jgi:lysozyme
MQGATVANGAGVASSTMGQDEARKKGAQSAVPARDAHVGTAQPSDDYYYNNYNEFATEERMQFALMILIICAVLYIVFARVDDWRRYRR